MVFYVLWKHPGLALLSLTPVCNVQVVKKTGATLQIRTVQPPLVAQWNKRIQDLQRDIEHIGQVRLAFSHASFLRPSVSLLTNFLSCLSHPSQNLALYCCCCWIYKLPLDIQAGSCLAEFVLSSAAKNS
jgi:hypothetical protein